MKYLYFIVILFLLPSCSYNAEKEEYDYLPNNSLRFIRNDKEVSVLINKDNNYYLLLIGRENIDIDVDYLIKYQDIKTNIKGREEYLLNKNFTIDDVTFKINNKLEIILNKQNICIYLRELNRDDFSSCDFIYLYDPEEDFYITLNNNILALFYNSYTKFKYPFLYHMAEVWIDTYTIDDNSYLTLTLYSDNFKVTTNKIKSKTIHKRKKT